MDKYVIRLNDPSDLPCDHQLLISSALNKQSTPALTKRRSLLSSYEIHGRILPSYKRYLVKLMLESYSEIGSFVQSGPAFELSRRAINEDFAYLRNAGVDPFARYDTQVPAPGSRFMNYTKRRNVSCVDFDSKVGQAIIGPSVSLQRLLYILMHSLHVWPTGIYLASVNTDGHLMVHEFETLYCSATSGSNEAFASFFQYIPTGKVLEAVKWNPVNQDEVACAASGSNEVYFYDIACYSCRPEVLRVKSDAATTGLYDLLMCKLGTARVLACGKDGNVHIWDRRASKLSYAALPVPSVTGALNSLQLSNDEQVVYAGSEGGLIYAWDLRGGKRGAAFVTCGEVYHQPLGAVKVSTLLSSISSLRAQTEIGASAVRSISLDSSCGHRLAFHLNNGWSGVLDMATLDITHLHCPPPWFIREGLNNVSPWNNPSFLSSGPVIQRRRPVWIPSLSVYAVGSTSECKIHMLDFSSGPKSRYSIDHDGSISDQSDEQCQIEVPTSDEVVVIAAHPLNDQLVAGTQCGKLLLLGQKSSSIIEQHQ